MDPNQLWKPLWVPWHPPCASWGIDEHFSKHSCSQRLRQSIRPSGSQQRPRTFQENPFEHVNWCDHETATKGIWNDMEGPIGSDFAQSVRRFRLCTCSPAKPESLLRQRVCQEVRNSMSDIHRQTPFGGKLFGVVVKIRVGGCYFVGATRTRHTLFIFITILQHAV
jgi:hypothetical protein